MHELMTSVGNGQTFATAKTGVRISPSDITALFKKHTGKIFYNTCTEEPLKNVVFAHYPCMTKGTAIEPVRRIVEEELKIGWCLQPKAAYALYFPKDKDLVLHVDDSATTSIRPMLEGLARLAQTDVYKLHLRTIEALRTQKVQCSVLHVHGGDMLCFLGSRLHGVHNIEPSFSFGVHCTKDEHDEFVVYGVLSGEKKIVMFDCGDRQMEAYLHSLGIVMTDAMFDKSTAVEALLHAVQCVEVRDRQAAVGE